MSHKSYPKSSSGERCIYKEGRRWRVSIALGINTFYRSLDSGNHIFIGLFATLAEAIKARDVAEVHLSTFDADDAPPVPEPGRASAGVGPHRARCSRWTKDPRERNITRRGQRWAVRIAGGKNGVKVYVGMYATLGEAMTARDAAEA